MPVLITTSNSFYAAQVTCKYEKSIMNRIVVGLYVTGLKVIPVTITASMSIASGVYLYKHGVSDRNKRDFLTAMAYLGHTLRTFIRKIFPSVSKVATFYIFFALYNLSLWPTPILVIVYMRKSCSFKTLPCM